MQIVEGESGWYMKAFVMHINSNVKESLTQGWKIREAQ